MSDNYQAVYDAVRSRIAGANVGEVLRDVAREAFDISYPRDWIRDELISAARELQRPSVVYRPELVMQGCEPGGDHGHVRAIWEARYGDVRVRGASPAEAMAAFDRVWSST